MFNLLKMRRSVVKPLAGPECGQVSKVYTCQFENAASRHRNLQIYRLCEHTGQCHFCLCQDVEHFEPKYPISEANRVHNLAIYMPSVVNLPNAVLNTSFWIGVCIILILVFKGANSHYRQCNNTLITMSERPQDVEKLFVNNQAVKPAFHKLFSLVTLFLSSVMLTSDIIYDIIGFPRTHPSHTIEFSYFFLQIGLLLCGFSVAAAISPRAVISIISLCIGLCVLAGKYAIAIDSTPLKNLIFVVLKLNFLLPASFFFEYMSDGKQHIITIRTFPVYVAINVSFIAAVLALPEEAIVKVFTAVAFSLAPLLYTSLSSVDKLYHTLQFKQRVLRLAGLLGYIGMYFLWLEYLPQCGTTLHRLAYTLLCLCLGMLFFSFACVGHARIWQTSSQDWIILSRNESSLLS